MDYREELCPRDLINELLQRVTEYVIPTYTLQKLPNVYKKGLYKALVI
jgi:hypothetical protein